MEITTEGNNNNAATGNVAIPTEQPTEDADTAQANTTLPTAQLTNRFETLTTQTETELDVDDCETTSELQHPVDRDNTDPSHYPILP